MATYNYKIELDNVKETIEKATAGGYGVYIIINGEYYEIETEDKKA